MNRISLLAVLLLFAIAVNAQETTIQNQNEWNALIKASNYELSDKSHVLIMEDANIALEHSFTNQGRIDNKGTLRLSSGINLTNGGIVNNFKNFYLDGKVINLEKAELNTAGILELKGSAVILNQGEIKNIGLIELNASSVIEHHGMLMSKGQVIVKSEKGIKDLGGQIRTLEPIQNN